MPYNDCVPLYFRGCPWCGAGRCVEGPFQMKSHAKILVFLAFGLMLALLQQPTQTQSSTPAPTSASTSAATDAAPLAWPVPAATEKQIAEARTCDIDKVAQAQYPSVSK